MARALLQEAVPPSDAMGDLFQSMSVQGMDSAIPPPIRRSGECSSTAARQAEFEKKANPYRVWYDLVEEDRRHNPIFDEENEHALSIKAQKFALSVGDDSYAAGIWHGDLLTGLLWHDSEFEASQSAVGGKPLRKPASPLRAPSWTWTALDGSIRFLREAACDLMSSKPPLVRDLRAYTVAASTLSLFGSVRMQNGCISLTGKMRELEEIRGFNEAFATWMRDNRPHLDYDCTPDISMDPDFVLDCAKYVLPLVRKRCDPRCRHSTGCDKDQMAYGLILHFVGQGPQYDNLPGLKLARKQSGGKVKPVVEIFMRCGIAAFYMSSFENAPWQDAVIV